MSLPRPWVDKIFSKLTLTYGRDFLSRWEGLSPDDVKDDWADELGGYVNAPQDIAYALSILPADKPPTVIQFRELCRRAPVVAPPALPAPKPDPERLSAALKRLGSMEAPRLNGKQWAHDLKAREERSRAGLTRFQREAWREALKQEVEVPRSVAVNEIDPNVLPVAMRPRAGCTGDV